MVLGECEGRGHGERPSGRPRIELLSACLTQQRGIMLRAFAIGLLFLSAACGHTSSSNTTDSGTLGTDTTPCTGTLCQDPSLCVGADAGTLDVSSSGCAAMGEYNPTAKATSIIVLLTYDDSTRLSSVRIYLPGFITTGTFTDSTVGPLPSAVLSEFNAERYVRCYGPKISGAPDWASAQAELPDGGQLGSFSLTLTEVTQGHSTTSDLLYFIHGHAHVVCAPDPTMPNQTATGVVTLDVTF